MRYVQLTYQQKHLSLEYPCIDGYGVLIVLLTLDIVVLQDRVKAGYFAVYS